MVGTLLSLSWRELRISHFIRVFALGTVFLMMVAQVVTPGEATAQESSVASSPEQELIDRYAPIVGLKTQTEACDTDGEPFVPVPIDVWFNDSQVALKQAEDGGSADSDPVIKQAPTGADLFDLGEDYYLDFPGEPRNPGCGYEQWFDSRKGNLEPTTYAHIKSDGLNQIAVQYWFYYVYNNFNNKHESDWEMMQLVWDVPTVEEALQTDPVEIALAQHGGGETADWNDSKVHKEGNRVIVYSAAGSHASQYGNAVYLGWGENGTGFGCDTTTAPTTEVPLTAVLLPDEIPAQGSEFDWLTFEGRWGERQSGQYNGPTGPRMKAQWLAPFIWQDKLRDTSMEVPTSDTLGPQPTEVFCKLSTFGSALFTNLGNNPVGVIALIFAIGAGVAGLYRVARATIKRAIAIYRIHWRTFAIIGLVIIPLGFLFNGFQYLIRTIPPGEQFFKLLNEQNQTGDLAAAFVSMSLQHFVGFIIVGPAVIAAYEAFERNEKVSVRSAYHQAFRQFPATVKAVLLMLAVIVPLTLLIIGIPVAVWLFVRWLFVPQAVMLDEEHGKGALRRSADAVGDIRSWLRTTSISVLLLLFGAMPGPLIALFFLIIRSRSLEFTSAISSLVYAICLPFSILGLTVLYRQLQGDKFQSTTETPVPNESEGPSPAPVGVG